MNTRWHAVAVLSLLLNHSAFANSSLTRLYSFGTGNNAAANPYGRLLQAADGKVYGTTSAGGAAGQGTVFVMNPDGSGFAVLHRFGLIAGDGARPFGALLEASDGSLYGTTEAGGQNGLGTVYKLNKDGSSFVLLRSFAGNDGANPEAGLIEGSDGLLYGTTSGGGTNDYGVVF